MLKIINQDILELDYGIICHQVNCVGVMGSGLALKIKNKWPQVYSYYKEYVDNNSAEGSAQLICVVPHGLYVANIFGQVFYGRDRVYTDLMLVASAFAQLKSLIIRDSLEELPVYVPYNMGCGLGGGNWKDYSKLIEHYLPEAIICKNV